MSKREELQSLVESTFYVMEEKGYNILNNSDTDKMMKDKNVFTHFAESLAEGLEGVMKKDFLTLAENSRQDYLVESNTSANLSNFAVLQTTLLRSIYPRLFANRLISNKTLEVPSIEIGFLKQVFVSHNGNVSDVASALTENILNGPRISADITVPSASVNLFTLAGLSSAGGTTVDRKTRFTSFKVECLDSKGGNPETKVVTVNVSGGVNQDYLADITAVHSDGTVTKDKFFATLNRETGILACASTNNKIKAVTVDAYISLESNVYSGTIENRYEKQMIQVSDGDIINSSLPYSYIKDSKAFFNIDAYAEAVATIGTVFSQVIDLKIIADIRNAVSFSANPNESTLIYDAMNTVSGYDFGITRRDRNALLLDRINRAIGVVESRIPFNGAMTYNVMCNPIEGSILASTKETEYRGSVARGGVITNYTNTASYQNGNGDINVFSSKLVPAGEMYLVPMSSLDNEIVYGNYTYSQVLLPQGYLNPKAPNVTNVAMLNRQTQHFFRPDAIMKIDVKNSLHV